jgi:signal transduction histidine kinase
MAFVLSVQLFLGYRAQRELVDEMQRLSSNINQAIDAHYAGVLEKIESDDPLLEIDQTLPDTIFISPPPAPPAESLYLNIALELKNLGETESHLKKELKRVQSWTQAKSWQTADSLLRRLEKEKELRKFAFDSPSPEAVHVFENNRILKKSVEGTPQSDYQVYSPAVKIETIDIEVNGESLRKKIVIPPPADIPIPPEHLNPPEKLVIRFPDFSIPQQPKMIRYNYHLAGIENALTASLNRNILITIGLFAISLLAILLVSQRFLRPIGELKSSFDKVVAGDLDVSVPVKSADEIGGLTQAFNQMVNELQKNRQKEKLLQQKERLASMGQLAAGVAHEIKNPLNAIHLTIEHLQDKFTAKDKTAQKYIHTIQTEIIRLDKIVDNFLNFIRSENLQRTDTDLHGLINNVLQLLQKEIETCQITTEENFSGSFICSIDPERFKTVLLNLFINAIQAMPSGGRLTISTDPGQRQIIIADTGNGIPAENLDKIFDLFYTTKSKGTGLGLATSYKIIREHGGDITIQSEEGKGTIVTITI